MNPERVAKTCVAPDCDRLAVYRWDDGVWLCPGHDRERYAEQLRVGQIQRLGRSYP